ncbi:MAG: J domain-containing protein, partial [Rhodovulum sp.]
MTPIERVRARAEALADLGLGYYATDREIEEAWHRIARTCHPDRDAAQVDVFTRAKLARDFLIGDRPTGRADADGGVVPRRIRGRGTAAVRPVMPLG